ncbi:hypothetical protein [Saccharopolyspora griseoalba]|uniref:Zinc finger protein n=1 Tax=Saccharopolyspora griseoalba TaxID=1431848 RepID=A0ABW2LMI8_9PSEU
MHDEVQRHFWLPVADPGGRGGTRHAFPGRRWEGERTREAICGEQLPLANPSEMDWICHPTCTTCWNTLRNKQFGR